MGKSRYNQDTLIEKLQAAIHDGMTQVAVRVERLDGSRVTYDGCPDGVDVMAKTVETSDGNRKRVGDADRLFEVLSGHIEEAAKSSKYTKVFLHFYGTTRSQELGNVIAWKIGQKQLYSSMTANAQNGVIASPDFRTLEASVSLAEKTYNFSTGLTKAAIAALCQQTEYAEKRALSAEMRCEKLQEQKDALQSKYDAEKEKNRDLERKMHELEMASSDSMGVILGKVPEILVALGPSGPALAQAVLGALALIPSKGLKKALATIPKEAKDIVAKMLADVPGVPQIQENEPTS